MFQGVVFLCIAFTTLPHTSIKKQILKQKKSSTTT